jgi:peptidoglycan/LPS O-acetylase OafA/YrhL
MTQSTSKKGVYFPNLNGLRFIAALMVILHHYEYSTAIDEASAYGTFVIGVGKLGVMLFFTLSGFLITYLLLVEKKETGTINIKDFYVRRVLRIWPLYYLIVIGALFIFNNVMYLRIPGISMSIHQDFLLKCFLYLAMLPNIAYALQFDLPFASQTWSIGIEEQFYLFWPILIKRSKRVFRPFFLVIISYLTLKTIFYVLNIFYPNTIINNIYFLIRLSCFDVMALGGFAALVLFYNNKLLAILFAKPTQIITLLVLVLLIAKGVNFGFFQYEIYSLLFAIVIINLAGNKKTVINLENGVLHYLGKISFGLYMYHFLSIRIVELIVIKLSFLHNHWLHFLIVVIVTIILSAISYELFEKFFIKRKIKYSKIISGDNYKA